MKRLCTRLVHQALGEYRKFVRWVLAGGLALSLYGNALPQSLTWLGALEGQESVAMDISEDGQRVVGYISSAAGREVAFLWMPARGLMPLATLGGRDGRALGISPNGNFVVGWSMRSDSRVVPTVWAAPFFNPTPVPVPDGIVFDVDDAGRVVGFYGNALAFLWDRPSALLLPLGHLGCRVSEAYAIATIAGRSVVVGQSLTPSGGEHAFRWTLLTGMVSLGTLGGRWSKAFGISNDGQVIVGTSAVDNTLWNRRAFRWSAATGIVNLGLIAGGSWTEAYDCDATGTIVVGWGDNARGQPTAFRWTPAGGIEDLNITYAALLGTGARLEAVRSITGDGRYFAGYGRNPATGRREAFLLDTRCIAHNGDVDSNGCIEDADLLAVLFAFGQTGPNLGRVDVNCNGRVDDEDLLIVLFNFGGGC